MILKTAKHLLVTGVSTFKGCSLGRRFMPGRSKIAETYLFSQISVAVTQKIYFSLECF